MLIILIYFGNQNEINVWNWKREYSPEEEMLDGHIWELSTSNTGRSKKFGGSTLTQKILMT